MSYLWFTNGDSNFFNNKSHNYNTIIYVLERLNNYDFYIYIDQDYESSQWATRLMSGEINVINQNKPSDFNAADEDNIYIYENILNRLIKEKKKIVRWYIEKKVDIFPKLSIESYVMSCVSSNRESF